MATIVLTHEVNDSDRWAKVWQRGGSRHEIVTQMGGSARTFRDAQNPNLVGLVLEVPDVNQFMAMAQSPEMMKAAEEDGVKIETLRILPELVP
jgi:hypothetical protein